MYLKFKLILTIMETIKDSAITIKISCEEVSLIKKASALHGMGHTTFLRMVGLKAARQILMENGFEE